MAFLWFVIPGAVAGAFAYHVAASNKERHPWLWFLVAFAVVAPVSLWCAVTFGTDSISSN